MSFLFQPLYRAYRAYSGVRYWMRRRFTLGGFALLIGLIATGLLGPDTDNNVAYQAFALLLCLVVIAMVASVGFRARFAAARHLPRFGTVGVPFTYTVRIRNLTTTPQAGLTLLEDLARIFHSWTRSRLSEALFEPAEGIKHLVLERRRLVIQCAWGGRGQEWRFSTVWGQAPPQPCRRTAKSAFGIATGGVKSALAPVRPGAAGRAERVVGAGRHCSIAHTPGARSRAPGRPL